MTTSSLPEANKHTIIIIVSSKPTQINIYDELRLREIAISYTFIDQNCKDRAALVYRTDASLFSGLASRRSNDRVFESRLH